MYIDREAIANWDRKYRLKLINSISGYKGVHLIGTHGKNGVDNVAIFNSIVHISSFPAMIGFIMRPLSDEHQTYQNIMDQKEFTINHVHKSFLKKAHYTSANFPADISEFERCGLTPEFVEGFGAPFVEKSKIKMGLELREVKEIEVNQSFLIIGEVVHIHIEEDLIEEDGQLDLEKAHDVCVTGLNQYSSVSKHERYPYARVEEVPDLKKKERPDNVVFDEETQTYNANILPYGTNIGSPSILPSNVSDWKDVSIRKFNNSFNSKIEKIKEHYQQLVSEFELNEQVYSAKLNFEPIVGNTYHLYRNDRGDNFLSMIEPHTWKKEHLGTFRLNHDHTWKMVSD